MQPNQFPYKSNHQRLTPPFGDAEILADANIIYAAQIVEESLQQENINLLSSAHQSGYWVQFFVDNTHNAFTDMNNKLVSGFTKTKFGRGHNEPCYYFAGAINKVVCGEELPYYKDEVAIRGLIAYRNSTQGSIAPKFLGADIMFIKKSDLDRYQDQIDRHNQSLSAE